MSKILYSEKTKRPDKLSRNEQMELMFDLVNSFRSVRNPVETINFLQDLFTAKEIKNLSKRLRIAKLLLSNQTHEEIVRDIHCSYGAVAKVSMWLTEGGSGFRDVIAKLPLRYEIPRDLPPIPIEFHLPKVLTALYKYSKANSQNKNIESFFEGVKKKEYLDKEFREQISDDYKGRKHKKHSITT